MSGAETVSFKVFARMLGERSPSYVTQLKAEGRLVLTSDGKRVRVAESLALVRATADPAKTGVTARHAADRQAKAGEGAAPLPMAPPASIGEAEPQLDEIGGGQGYQYWRERNERARALASERDNALADGLLMVAAEVEAAIAAAATTLRTRLESLPDVLGPQLTAITDEAQARATLAEAIEHALDEVSRQFLAISRRVIS